MIEPPVSVPIEATVVLEFPTIRLVIVAKVEKREEMNPLVVVLLVAIELAEKKLVVVIPPVEEALVKVVCPVT